MQPNVTPGAVLELHAAKANGGLSPGVNSPLTTTFFDTSGNGNHGTLQTFAGTEASGYAGTGTVADPYRLVFESTTPGDFVYVADAATLRFGTGDWSLEMWLMLPWYGLKSGSNNWVIAKGITTSAPAGTWGVGGINAPSGSNNLYFRDSYTNGAYNARISRILAAGLTHYVVTRASGVYRVYTGGLLNGSPVTPANVADLNSTKRLHLATDFYESPNLAMSLPLVRLYPFALTPEQVAQNYAAGLRWLSRRPSGLLVYQSGRSAAAWQ